MSSSGSFEVRNLGVVRKTDAVRFERLVFHISSFVFIFLFRLNETKRQPLTTDCLTSVPPYLTISVVAQYARQVCIPILS